MKLKIKKSEAFRRGVKKLKNFEIAGGWFENTRYEKNLEVGQVAYWQEYGTNTIPPRPFIRPAIEENKNKWLNEINKGVDMVLWGGKSPLEHFRKIAFDVQGKIQEYIVKVETPPLKESTVRGRARRRGLTSEQITDTLRKPLVDTGTMLATVQSKAEEK